MPTPEIRIGPGEEGRAAYLEECLTLDALVAETVEELAQAEELLAAGPVIANPYGGFKPSRLRVSGSEVSGNLVELISMGDSDKWVVRNGSKMRTTKGPWVRYTAHPDERLKKNCAHSLEAAIAAVS